METAAGAETPRSSEEESRAVATFRPRFAPGVCGIEPVKENRCQQREARGNADPEQASLQHVDCPVDSIPGKSSNCAFAANGQAETEILRTAGIERVQGASCAAVEELQAGGIVAASSAQGDGGGPQKEIYNVPNASAQDWERFEEHGNAGRQKHGGHCEKNERRPEFPEREGMGFGTYQLHGQGGQHEDHDHAGEYGEIAEGFRERVKILAHGSGGEDLPDPRVGIALHSILHDVEAGQRQKSGAAHGHQSADPRGVVDATVSLTDHQPDLLGGDGVSEIQSRSEGDEETVAANALQEIGADHVVQHAQGVHAATPARCCERQ